VVLPIWGCGPVCRFVLDRVSASDGLAMLLASEKLCGHYRNRIVSPLLSPSIAGMACGACTFIAVNFYNAVCIDSYICIMSIFILTGIEFVERLYIR
jgi:hypothetical protein